MQTLFYWKMYKLTVKTDEAYVYQWESLSEWQRDGDKKRQRRKVPEGHYETNNASHAETNESQLDSFPACRFMAVYLGETERRITQGAANTCTINTILLKKTLSLDIHHGWISNKWDFGLSAMDRKVPGETRHLLGKSKWSTALFFLRNNPHWIDRFANYLTTWYFNKDLK